MKYNFNIDIDNIDDKSLSKSRKTVITQKQSYLDNMYVDLDLPSHTLWATHNIGVKEYDVQNLHKNSKKVIGNYYAWGETKTKRSYSWENYEHAKGVYYSLSKYCTSPTFGCVANGFPNGLVDDLIILEKVDDVATQKLGAKWSIPTKDQFQELIDTAYRVWIDKYIFGNSFTGLILKSPENPEKSIIFPTTGYYWNDDESLKVSYIDTDGYYWTSTLDDNDPSCACCFHFNMNNRLVEICCMDRCSGIAVRPVTY